MENLKKWHAHYPKDIPTTLTYEEKPLTYFLEKTAEEHGDRTAIHFMGKEMSFFEIAHEAKKVAHYLQALGIKKGDRVAIMLPNCPQAVISYYGALFIGAIVVQTNPLYKARELEYQLNDSGATCMICLDILFPLVTSVKDNTSLKHIIVTSIKDYLPFPKNVIYPFIQKRQYGKVPKVVADDYHHIWTEFMPVTSSEFKRVEIDPKEDLALLQYTGGTTGRPKGVMLTHFNLVANVQMCQAWLYKKPKDKQECILGVLPFFHVYGMTTVMNMAIFNGAKMILLPKFEPGQVLKTIHKLKPTLFPGAPTIYIGLLNHPKLTSYDLSSIEACISGSAPLPVEIQEKFEKITGGRLVEGYGLTESSPVTHANFVWDKRVNGSIGVPWPDTDAKIVHMETYQDVEFGEIGEIVVKGPQIMKGYWNNDEATHEALRDGWLYTGDLGYMDEDGYFYVVDRKKDMIIAGGYNIYPREVEDVLYEHEAVQEAVVVGIPDEYRGETVKAYIVLRPGYQVTEAEMDQFCREHLASYKVPRAYEFRKELPKSAIGKILRKALIEEHLSKQK